MSPGVEQVGRILSRDKVIENRMLNQIGVQVFRMLLARLDYHLRPTKIDEAVKDQVAELKREGIVLLRDFLPASDFGLLRSECLKTLDQCRDKVEVQRPGPNSLEVIYARDFGDDLDAYASRFFDEPQLHAIAEAVEKRPLAGKFGVRLLERLTQQPGAEEKDPETDLHSDIFYSVHKAWLYLSDVELADGPLVYVKRSHRLSPTQIIYVYKESCGPNAGSRRITAEEVRRLGFQETIVTCPQNTLVIANTFGYHRRLMGQPGRQRLALNLSLRAKPFAWNR